MTPFLGEQWTNRVLNIALTHVSVLKKGTSNPWLQKRLSFARKDALWCLKNPPKKKQVNRYATGESHHSIGCQGTPFSSTSPPAASNSASKLGGFNPLKKYIYVNICISMYFCYQTFGVPYLWITLLWESGSEGGREGVREGANEMCGHMCVRLCFCFWIYIHYYMC